MSDTNTLLEVKGYFGRYLVSDTGDVWSFKNGALRKLKPYYGNSGYARVALFDENGEKKQPLVHKLVADAFLGECPDGYQVDHINGNRSDNDVMNLRYVRPSVNCRLAFARNGCGSNPYGGKGRRVIAWRDGIVMEFPTVREAARCLHRNWTSVSYCCHGLQQTCAGYRMAFAEDVEKGLVDDVPEEYRKGDA